MPRRPCLDCGKLTTNTRCTPCARGQARTRERTRDRPTTTERGYGATHQAMRLTVQPIVDAGEAVCWRCGQGIPPGTPWDLGHDDRDRTRYRGPEHVRCNRATAGRRDQ